MPAKRIAINRTRHCRMKLQSAHGTEGWQAMVAQSAHELVVRQTGLRVAQGPFAGLKLSDRIAGTEFLPKLIGSYEMELHGVIEEFLAGEYDVLINIGCAEGYYAVGFAVRWRDFSRRVLAFDVNPTALKVTREVAALNGVADKVECFAECRHETFALASQVRALIICDIEGAERELLDPERGPGLRRCDLLVELHDGKGPPLIRTELERRFSSSHQHCVIRASKRTGAELGALAAKIPAQLAALALDERRSRGLEWMVMKMKPHEDALQRSADFGSLSALRKNPVP
jgi:hypothetical protein